MHATAYKIENRDDLLQSLRTGIYYGSQKDKQDGFIHLSTLSQLKETLSLHFKNIPNLAVAEINLDSCGNAIRWEDSRNGEKFPHLYSPLSTKAIIKIIDAEYDGTMPLIPRSFNNHGFILYNK